MHFHWQNLNDKPGGRQGSGIVHGRAWLRFGDYSTNRTNFGWEWSLFSSRCGVSFRAEQSEDTGLGFSVSVPWLLSFYLHLNGGLFAWLARKLLAAVEHSDRELYLRIHGGALWWTIWRDPMGGWDRSVPRWRDGNFNFIDLVLGKPSYSERGLQVVETVVPMPERSYPATVKLYEGTWKRPRWFAQRIIRAEVDCKNNPIPHPGKGENSWDCGDDATYGLTTGPVRNVEDAIAQTVETVLRSRRRYGGSVNWQAAE